MKIILTVLLILTSSLLQAQQLTLSQVNEGDDLCWVLIKPESIGLAAGGKWITQKKLNKADFVRLTQIFKEEIKRNIDLLPSEEESDSTEPNCVLHIFAGDKHTSYDWKGRISDVTIIIEEIRKLVETDDIERFLEIVNPEPVGGDQ